MKFLPLLAALLILASCKNYGKKIPYGKSEVFYTENVTREQAQKLGDYLNQNHFFKDDKKASVQLDKSADTFLFRMVVLDNFVNDESYINNAKIFTTELSDKVFDQKPVLINFCDKYFSTVRVVRP